MKIEVSGSAPQEYKDLAWEVFFKSKNRGVALDIHFPFFKFNNFSCITINVSGKIVAGLVLIRVRQPKQNLVAGLIGLVCVHADHRGLGYSTALLHAAISHANTLQMDDLILWTAKPDVYRKLGFEIRDTAVFGSSCADGLLEHAKPDAVRSIWPGDGDERGLPPFALAGEKWSSPSASIIVLTDPVGPILAEWSGDDEDVLDVIKQCMPTNWRINALQEDGLPGKLAKASWEIILKPSNLQMMMNLRMRSDNVDPYKLRILDRV